MATRCFCIWANRFCKSAHAMQTNPKFVPSEDGLELCLDFAANGQKYKWSSVWENWLLIFCSPLALQLREHAVVTDDLEMAEE